MCCEALETLDHLFVDFPFAQDVWSLSMLGLNVSAPAQITVTNLFSTWKARYPLTLTSKSSWPKIWQVLPKYVCWKIWLARNTQIFNNIKLTPSIVATKAKALLHAAVVNHRSFTDNSLLPEEKKWLGTYLFRDRKKDLCSPLHQSRVANTRHEYHLLRMMEEPGQSHGLFLRCFERKSRYCRS